MSPPIHLVCPHCQAVNRVPAERLDQRGQCGKCHQPLWPDRPLTLDDAGLQRYLQREELPLLVDFWAAWCGPCRMMAPAFEAAAAQLAPRVRLAKLDTEASALAGQLGIRSIPTLILFRGGREIARQAGAMGQDAIVRWAQQQL